MKSRSIHIVIGILVLALALLACNLPEASDSIAPVAVATQPEARQPAPTTSETESCPPVELSPNPSGLVSAVTLAEDTAGEEREPVNPTTTFSTSATFHAVVSIVDAPTNTLLKAIWFAGDTRGVADCNTQIDAYELSTDGTRNIDFSLTPESTWPLGLYRVEIYANNVLDQAVYFSVK